LIIEASRSARSSYQSKDWMSRKTHHKLAKNKCWKQIGKKRCISGSLRSRVCIRL